MFQDQGVLDAFQLNGRAMLVEQTSQHLSQSLRGKLPSLGFREQLAVALRRLAQPECKLKLSEQVEIATFFLPLIRRYLNNAVTPGTEPVLQLSGEIIDNSYARLLATVAPGSANLTSLTLLRRGLALVSTKDIVLPYNDYKTLPARVTYQAQATYSNYPSQLAELTLTRNRYWRFGVGLAQNISATFVQNLPQVVAASSVTLTFVTNEPQLMLVWIPKDFNLTGIYNPQFGPQNLWASFQSSPLTLPDDGPGVLWQSYQRILSSNYQLTFTAS